MLEPVLGLNRIDAHSTDGIRHAYGRLRGGLGLGFAVSGAAMFAGGRHGDQRHALLTQDAVQSYTDRSAFLETNTRT